MPGKEFWGGVLQFIPSVTLFFLTRTSSGVSVIEFQGLLHKIADFSSPILLYQPLMQLIVVALFVTVVACSIFKKWAQIPPPCWFVIIAGVICALSAPSMMFNSYFLSHRMPVALSFFFLATIQFVNFDRRIARWFRGALVVTVVAHVMFISLHWSKYQLIYKDLFAATRLVQEGDKVLSMTMGTVSNSANLRPPLIRAVEYLIPTKKIFSPHILADSWHQPIRLTEQAQILKNMAPAPLFSPKPNQRPKLVGAFENSVFHRFDYVLIIRMDKYEKLIPKNWILREQVGQFRLYQPGVN